ncbi:uncharacterized protein ATC70_007910 [Mucor velutinosus]|uniref:Uncharacterized protein n=1 Tax=Mucor velutinosus TaxID=708070 RepID=A0AAN7HW90_9FUNG|nr:hypothetical protein ATC70_007910 [Mucor velutinosus]
MSKYIPSSFNKCYCCLSLRAGVFLNSLCSLTIPYLIETVSAASDYLEDPKVNTPASYRYFHTTVPYLDSPVDMFSMIHASTYAIGLVGSYNKSPKLIKYHKNLLYFNVISTPFILIECLWTAPLKWPEINVPDGPDVPEFFERDMKTMCAIMIALLFGYFGVSYAQQIYAAYVATKYEKYLLLSEESKEK